MKEYSHAKTSDIVLDMNYFFRSKGFKLLAGRWQLVQQLTIANDYFDSIPLSNITKIKIKGEKGLNNCEILTYVIKLTIKDKDFFYAFDQTSHMEWMLHLVWGKFY